MTWSLRLVLLGLLVALTGGCGCSGDTRMNAGGSTFIFPMMSKWATEYKKATGVEVNYQPIGSSAGIDRMTNKIFDFGCTDGPLSPAEHKKARETGGEVVHIPLLMGGVVPAYNLKEATKPVRFTGPILADIYLGKIKKWNDSGLQKLNPNVSLPNKTITVVHRSDGSGTTYIWTDYLSRVSEEWKAKARVGKKLDWPCGVGEPGNEGVTRRVKESPNAIGYITFTHALQAGLPFGLVRNKAGEFIEANPESIAEAARRAEDVDHIPDDLHDYSLVDQAGKNVYPITGTTWAVLYVNQLDTGKGRELVRFLRWVTHEGQEFVQGMHYVPIPNALRERAVMQLDNVKWHK
jgi:phosphate transport system substrate-binding protein